MATTILNTPNTDNPILTSDLYSLSAQTSSISVKVSVIRDPDGDIDEFFETNLYAHNGIVTFSDIGSLIEGRLREVNRISDIFEIKIGDASFEFVALYCEYQLDSLFSSEGYLRSFFSSSYTRLVTRNSRIHLAYWNNGQIAFVFRFVGKDFSGKIISAETPFQLEAGFDSFDLPVSTILTFAPASLAEISYFAISFGEAQKMFFLTDDIPCISFEYKNMFNATDYIDIFGSITTKTAVSREEAVCSGNTQQYNRILSRSYEVQTGPLTDDQVREFEQLVASHQVLLPSHGHKFPILITDHTVEVSDNDEALPSVKFTFRFASNRINITLANMGALARVAPGIFTKEFTDQFS